MEFGINLFGGDPAQWPALVKRADELGYDVVWMSYHLITPLEWQSRYPHHESGRPGPYNPQTPFVDPWVAFGHFAAITERIKFGTGVYILPLVNPFVTARAVASAQLYSGGRLLFGIGSGWMAEEFQAVGENYSNRAARMDEILDILQELWSGQPVGHDGKFYQFEPVLFTPKPSTRIPIIFGGEAEPALRRAALRGDGWRSIGPYDRTLATIRRLKVLREEAGRGHIPFQIWGSAPGDPTLENLRRCQEDGISHVTVALWPFDVPMTLQEKLASLTRYAEETMIRAKSELS